MKRIFMLFAVLALVASTAFAQNGVFAPYVSGSVATSSALGYKNPSGTVSAGIESSTKYLLLDIHGSVATADVVTAYQNKSVGNTNLALQVSGYYKFFNHILAGAGADLSTNTASLVALQNVKGGVEMVRDSAHPFVGAGVQFGKLRSIVTYDLPGKDALNNERIVNINTEYAAFKHVRLTQNTTLNSYINSFTPGGIRVTGTQLGVGVKFVL